MRNMALTITESLIRKLLATVDVGLHAGLGVPEPGNMCVEAAIAFALGEPHGDGPTCVHPVVRAGNIILSDCAWSSDLARANGMRRVAIAQLGSTEIDYIKYVTLLAQYTQDEIVPLAAASASAAKYAKYAAKYAKYAAKYAQYDQYAQYAQYAAASAQYAAQYAAASAAASAAQDAALRLSAELMVRALQECGSPGCGWLWLCEEAPCDTTTREP